MNAVRSRSATRIAGAFRGVTALLLLLCLAGCFFASDDTAAASPGGTWDDFPNRLANTCGDITPAQMSAADSLVGAAQPLLGAESDYYGYAHVTWDDAKARNTAPMGTYYKQALAQAPNHCGALFGDAVANLLGVVGEPSLDSLVQDGNGGNLDRGALLKVSAADAPNVLLKIRARLAEGRSPFVAEALDETEKVFLPNLDSAIADLERVMGNADFAFDFPSKGRVYRLRRSEVGPVLATLRLVKAVLILAAGYEWNPEPGDSMPNIETVSHLESDRLDSLTARDSAALDYVTGLAKPGSFFTRIRAGWKDRVASIPTLLLQSIGDVQDGLRYSIAHSDSEQKYAPYRVGKGEDADVDPSDLQTAVDRLEDAKKYLRGEVPLSFNKGRDTLRVDFPRLFLIDGFQGLLPYFRFHPYPTWNDTVADSAHSGRVLGPIYFTDAAGNKTLEGAELQDYQERLGDLQGRVLFPDPTFGGVFPGLSNENIWAKLSALGDVEASRDSVCAPGGTCKPKLPRNPTDLDYIVYYLSRLNPFPDSSPAPQ